MKTNDLKKGHKILLENGWYAIIADNLKGTIRMADVAGHYRELGSVYAHDIKYYLMGEDDDTINPNVQHPLCMGGEFSGMYAPVEHTPAQIKYRKFVKETGI